MSAPTRQLSVVIGVNGIGMGHAVRQSVIAQFLRDRGHHVRIVTNSLSRATYFRDLGFHAWTAWMPTLLARDGKLRASDAIRSNMRELPAGIARHLTLRRSIGADGVPDVFVTDYEPNTSRLAYHFDKPLVCLDQQSKYRYLDLPPIGRYTRAADEQRLRYFIPRATRAFACSFIPLNSPSSNVEFISPVIPDFIRQHRVDTEPLSTAYFSRYFGHGPEASVRKLAKVFRRHVPDRSLRIYVHASEIARLRQYAGGKVEVCTFDREGFVADLARSEAVFTNGGFNLISEAITLGKPLHIVPLPTYDQHWCAAAVEDAGLGTSAPAIDRDGVLEFLERRDDMAQAVDQHRKKHLGPDPRERIAAFLEDRCRPGMASPLAQCR